MTFSLQAWEFGESHLGQVYANNLGILFVFISCVWRETHGVSHVRESSVWMSNKSLHASRENSIIFNPTRYTTSWESSCALLQTDIDLQNPPKKSRSYSERDGARGFSTLFFLYMVVSWHGGTPKSSIFLMGFSIVNHSFWVPHLWKPKCLSYRSFCPSGLPDDSQRFQMSHLWWHAVEDFDHRPQWRVTDFLRETYGVYITEQEHLWWWMFMVCMCVYIYIHILYNEYIYQKKRRQLSINQEVCLGL